jgi:hypothetical protein
MTNFTATTKRRAFLSSTHLKKEGKNLERRYRFKCYEKFYQGKIALSLAACQVTTGTIFVINQFEKRG